jgi:hypothetical protein
MMIFQKMGIIGERRRGCNMYKKVSGQVHWYRPCKIYTKSEDCTGLTRLMEGLPQRVKGLSVQ